MRSFRSFVQGVALLVLVLFLQACAGSRQLSDLPSTQVEGRYTAGPDGQWFRPCGEDSGTEAWWVTFVDEAAAQREAGPYAGLLTSGAPVFVRWQAAMGDRAEGAPAGPGPGTRYVLVREILEVRTFAEGDCVAN